MINEIWKDIKGYEGLYQVSNIGRVKSLKKEVNGRGNKIRIVKERILKPVIVYNGYERVILSKNCKTKLYRVNRLVAQAFIPNNNNYPIINHIDGNKRNNIVDNLEWCSYSHNNREAYRLGLKKYSPKRLVKKETNERTI